MCVINWEEFATVPSKAFSRAFRVALLMVAANVSPWPGTGLMGDIQARLSSVGLCDNDMVRAMRDETMNCHHWLKMASQMIRVLNYKHVNVNAF